MKVFFDTSVLIAAMVEAHPAHTSALPRLQRAKNKTDVGLVASHSLAELYAVLTTLPIRPRITPALARQLIWQNVLNVLEIVPVLKEDYEAILDDLSSREMIGGIVYDAIILHTALKENVDQVVTLNEKDFRRVYPDLSNRIVSP